MLTLGLPSKGRLQQDAVDRFAAAGVRVERSPEGREYAGHVSGLPDAGLALLSAGEIPRALAEGAIHVGVTGEDLIREHIPDAETRIALPLRLGFGRADLIVAVPAFWVDVETMHDLDEAAAAFRARHGRPMRVATKYHALTRRFFAQAGVADYRLVDSQGATEATPKNRAAELIVDITSSGETLRANHLRVLEDGLILRSEAMLCVSRAAPWGPAARRALAELGHRLGFDGEGIALGG
ncbi:ATP phosphoribosyltransferase [Rubrimonas cliftonensis]|uniref:ATP phosphoribosyltransferase n=1 Tax=Rubrimonas cliftonensis TaxID=89524 RepID=A0A1H3X4Z2_9RHOB|nr:ATP phosphoribosyltransferase [Rubrimonas cliftonensis]SDZ94310.1 ATP phosphoribosyltransferase catalytic subunit [Rubrimonas cliftonensis]